MKAFFTGLGHAAPAVPKGEGHISSGTVQKKNGDNVGGAGGDTTALDSRQKNASPSDEAGMISEEMLGEQ